MITSLRNLRLKETYVFIYKTEENATAFQFQMNLFRYWTEQAKNTTSLSTGQTRKVKPEIFTFGGTSNMLALKFVALKHFWNKT